MEQESVLKKRTFPGQVDDKRDSKTTTAEQCSSSSLLKKRTIHSWWLLLISPSLIACPSIPCFVFMQGWIALAYGVLSV